jgi:hypothetical protein
MVCSSQFVAYCAKGQDVLAAAMYKHHMHGTKVGIPRSFALASY